MKIFTPAFSLKAEADLLNKLALYLSANLSVSDGLNLLEKQARSARQRATFGRWAEIVADGKTLAQAFEEWQASGGRVLRVSELSRYSAELGARSGALATCLKEASLQIRKKIAVRKKIATAVAYPLVILAGTSLLVFGLMFFIFPKIIPLFETLKVSLPLSTRLLIGFSKTVSKNWLLMTLGVLGLGGGLIALMKFSARGRQLLEYGLIRTPIIGGLAKAQIIGSVFDSLVTLLRGGEQLSSALEAVSKTVNLTEYKTALSRASEMVSRGRSLADFFEENGALFPTYVFGIVAVGEKTGSLENAIGSIAEIVREDVDDKLRILTATLEPVLMVSMSVVIGFIALSIILPIYGITTHFQGA